MRVEAWLVELHDFLDTPDPSALVNPDGIGRGHHITVAGDPLRRKTVLLPLMTRWAQHRCLAKDAPLHIGKARKGFILRVADRRRRLA